MDLHVDAALVGRFYRIVRPAESGSLLERAKARAWVDLQDWPPYCSGFCRSSPPFDGKLEEDDGLLAYGQELGLSRLFLREERRSVSGSMTKTLAGQMAVDRLGLAFDHVSGTQRRSLLSEARTQLLRSCVPTVRIVPLVACREWVWLGRRAVRSHAPSDEGILRGICGVVELEPLVWGRPGTKVGWWTYARALGSALEASIDLSVDVQVTAVRFEKSPLKTTLDLRNADLRKMAHRLSVGSGYNIDQASFVVRQGLETVALSVDSTGIYRGEPPRSCGGLLHERLQRRFSDVRSAALRLSSVLHELYDSLK